MVHAAVNEQCKAIYNLQIREISSSVYFWFIRSIAFNLQNLEQSRSTLILCSMCEYHCLEGVKNSLLLSDSLKVWRERNT